MDDRFNEGDFLFYQLEAGFALLRLLGIDKKGNETIFQVSAFRDLFLDVEQIESAIEDSSTLKLDIPHVALSDRAFTATQVAKVGNAPLTDDELRILKEWRIDPDQVVSDRSIRLITGLR